MSESKQIIYILVGKGSKPLAGYTNLTGTFSEICLNCLKEVNPDSSAAINLDSGYRIFYINENSITYLLMTTGDYPKETAIGCLESVKKEFQSNYAGRDFDSESDFGLNSDFSPLLELKFNFYNENTDVTDELVKKVKDEMNRMKDQVVNALELMNERGDNINIVCEKADKLMEDSEVMKVKAKAVRKSECKKKVMLYGGISLAVLIIIYVIICIVCKSFTFQCSD